MMGKGSAPKSPDPKETAAAQTGTNVTTAIANGYLGNINQITPDGSLNYSYGDMKTITDPTTGATYQVPTTTVTQTLSPQQQAIKDQSDKASLNLSQLAANQSGRLDGLLGKPFNLDGAPAAGDPSKLNAPSYQQFGSGPQMQTNVKAGAIQGSIAGAGNVQNSLGNTGTVQTGLANAGQIGNSIANAGNIQSSLGNTGKVQTGLANAGNINTGIANAGNIQKGVANAGQIQTGLAGAGDITRSYDISQDTGRYEDALMQRMNPQLAQSREALETKLVNQGLQPGSEAYNRAIDSATRQENDARYGAILNAGQEQSRLAGLAANQASFQNSAQNQAYSQGLSSGQFANSAQAQQYSQNANDMQQANAAQSQQYQQNANNAAFGNAAQSQQFGQNLQAGQFANSAQAQQTQNALNAAQFGNSAQAQQFAQNQAQLNAQNSAQAQQFGQNLSSGQFANSAQAQQMQNALASGQFANSAQAQQFSQNQAQATFGNAAQSQAFAQASQNAGLANSANQQMFQNQNTATAGNNALKDQNFNAQQALLNSQNQARATYLNEQYALRNQPINEISALLNGGQATNPQFVPTQGQQIANVDYAGLVGQKYQNDVAAYNAQQQSVGGALGGLASMFSFAPITLSDKTTKRNIKKVGSLDGHGLYRYNYKGKHDDGREHIGVMAQDVQKKRPDAVVKRSDGKLAVNYGALFQAGA